MYIEPEKCSNTNKQNEVRSRFSCTIADNRGFALVTALMLTLISLTIIMSLMYMITKGTEISGYNKRYKSVLQASYGATDTVTKEIMKRVFEGINTPSALSTYYASSLSSLTVSDCFATKLGSSTGSWPSTCDAGTAPSQNPDLSFILQSTSDTPYRVYAKIVDTMSFGNTETAGGDSLREAHNVTEGGGGGGVVIPNTYRIEVQAERSNNPKERSQLSVLYAY